MRVCLFTDTLGDINGVSRFIRGVAEQSLLVGRSLDVLTSTRFACPAQPNIHNLAPHVAFAMPGYRHLELALPPRSRLVRLADSLRPDAVHVSTPGPVGLVGRAYAIRRRLPLLGTYHTDFPAYVDHLLEDEACTWLCRRVMERFYRPFDRVFTRSDEYARSVEALGVSPGRIPRLLPGIDTEAFHPRFRDGAIWGRLGIPPGAPKVLYVGRVSVEKNLPLLARVWAGVAAATDHLGEAAPVLVVVGDGPYRPPMEARLAGRRAHFLGFRHGPELSALYASSDLFAFPSTTDTLGQVVMEAQSAGLGVIVTDRGGPASVVNAQGRPDQTGYVLPATDAPRWAGVITRLCADPALRRALGANARRKIGPMSIRHSFEHFWGEHVAAVSGSVPAGAHATPAPAPSCPTPSTGPRTTA